MLVCLNCSSVLHSTIHKFYGLQTNSPLSSSLKSISTSTNQHSFTVNYLINSCGLSPETAISASKKVNLKTLDNPDSVLNFLINHGFSKTQVSSVIRKYPRLLLWDPKKKLLSIFDFFYSTGISSAELAKMVSNHPLILTRSLANHIIPSFILFINLFDSHHKFITAFKRFPRIVQSYSSANSFSNIEILRQHGVTDSKIVHLLTSQSRSLNFKPHRLNEVVEDVKKMGFNPSNTNILNAVQALLTMSKSTWERKMEVYEKWGWSGEETILAFKKFPWCMMVSEEKIMAVLNFYVNTMGWKSSLIATRPKLMTYSLGKRIIPRCSVLQVLLSKGLVKEPISAATLLDYRENLFLKKLVTCYEEEAPQLLKLYQQKLELSNSDARDYECKSGVHAQCVFKLNS
ncbi:uncharacterized protein LOC132270099 [Cornus florida]|uniref:uncharacterized protein LOC132270099 n=1 Tax=Cornus florida TaxID=4283 RepID=UPI00289E2E00|nr:uncharacterized protein LOC132270099 [Cornus florida]